MIRHLFVLMWARLSSNALLLAELGISFLVLFATVTFFLYNLGNARQPLGFAYENIWEVSILESHDPSFNALIERAMARVRQMPQVEAAENLELTPFSNNISITGGLQVDGTFHTTPYNVASAGMNRMLKIPLVAGRWFAETDDGADPAPVLIDQRLAKSMFGDRNPLGQIIHQDVQERVVIGVFDLFRYRGPFSSAEPYLFYLWSPSDFKQGHFVDKFHVAVKPGTSASFEKSLIDTLEAEIPGLTFQVVPWRVNYQKNREQALAPLYSLGLISGFLQLMVVLGLLGVLWQNVIGRKIEFGIRRAMGATARGVLWQIVGELQLLTVTGIAVCAVLLAQLPYGAWFPGLQTRTLLLGFAAAAGIALLLVGLCAGYAGLMAMKLRPADSLRGD